MEKIAQQHCVQITANTPKLDEMQIKTLMADLNGWKWYEKDGEARIEKSYKFEDFKQAITFTDKVAQIANAEDHHPALLTEYGKVTVTWWTHKIRGLHMNDFIMAAKTDQLS